MQMGLLVIKIKTKCKLTSVELPGGLFLAKNAMLER